MTVVETVLELLRAYLPGFEIDERWERWAAAPPAGVWPRPPWRQQARAAGPGREQAGARTRQEERASARTRRQEEQAGPGREPTGAGARRQEARTGPGRQQAGAGARQQRTGTPARGAPSLASCYAALGVARGADLRTVRRAWLRLVRRHHPDLCGGDAERQRLGTERVKQLNRAYEEIRKHRQRPAARAPV
jgi:DnaJ-domain-containing protein 1